MVKYGYNEFFISVFVISNNRLMFDYLFFIFPVNTPLYLASPLPPQNSTLEMLTPGREV